ncbi:hypothetical protein D3C76_1380870 [compost metagenome]
MSICAADGGLRPARTAGVKVNSRSTAAKMPMPVKMPNARTVSSSNTTSEKNPRAATPPAITSTGPTAASD